MGPNAPSDQPAAAGSHTPAQTPSMATEAIAAAMRRIDVSRLLAGSGVAQSLGVDKISLGQASIDRVNIQGVNADLAAGDTRLEGFRMVLRVRVVLRFSVFGISRERSASFGFRFNVGNVSIPDLDNITLQVPSAVLEDAAVEVQPVNDLDLGRAQFTDLRLDRTLLPATGFALEGMSVDGLRIEDVRVPATYTEALSVGTFSPDLPLRLPAATVTNLRLPDVDVPRVSSRAPIRIDNILPEDQGGSIGIDLILLSARVSVRPVVDIEISALTINDIEAAASIDRIALEDVSAPLTLTGLHLGELALSEVTVNRITV